MSEGKTYKDGYMLRNPDTGWWEYVEANQTDKGETTDEEDMEEEMTADFNYEHMLNENLIRLLEDNWNIYGFDHHDWITGALLMIDLKGMQKRMSRAAGIDTEE